MAIKNAPLQVGTRCGFLTIEELLKIKSNQTFMRFALLIVFLNWLVFLMGKLILNVAPFPSTLFTEIIT
jgi:hypothetical protein